MFRLFIATCLTTLLVNRSLAQKNQVQFIPADNKNIQYTGRIDFSNRDKPKFWAPGVYIKAMYEGSAITILVNDEYGGNNYLEIIIDDEKPLRIQVTDQTNEITVGDKLNDGKHTITIVKNTEANIGYLEFVGFKCKSLLPLPAKPKRKLEFIGNSITCGTGVDQSEVVCGKGKWHDQHNAYMSYGPRIARAFNAQYHISAYSGIGLIHSCCNLTMTMPEIFDKVNMGDNTIPWDFKSYQPDVVTICLGQNDGIQDSVKYTSAYVKFVETIRSHYPKAEIICLTSPMADEKLTTAIKNYLTGIVAHLNNNGDKHVDKFFFSRSWNNGCDGHPDTDDHEAIAKELESFLSKKMKWN